MHSPVQEPLSASAFLPCAWPGRLVGKHGMLLGRYWELGGRYNCEEVAKKRGEEGDLCTL